MTNTKLEQIILEMPQLKAERGLWQNAFHEFDVYDHTIEFVKYLKTMTSDKNMIVAGYFHDIGKPVVAKPKIKDGKIQEREPGKPYHEFDNHEEVGEQMVEQMDSKLFKGLYLDQKRISKLVGCHYLPMEGIKTLRKTKNYSEFLEKYSALNKTLETSGVPKIDILTMFLADKLAQGKFCTDREELLAIRDSLLGKENYSLEEIYQMQKKSYGGKE